jgi:tryptophan synthase alpha chain
MKESSKMSRRIESLFSKKRGEVVSLFLPAAYPSKEHTLPLIRVLEEEGVDMIELGMPFSDPIADGPVVQEANLIALRDGFTLQWMFSTIQELRKASSLPLVLMGHVNPVLRYGIEDFCCDARSAEVDGVILPDLPLNEYRGRYQLIVEKNRLNYIFLVTAETAIDRVKELDSLGSGFLYLVSSAAVTGGSFSVSEERRSYIQRMKNFGLRNPLVVGFGIDSPGSVREVLKLVDGVIIGSAFLRAIDPKHGDSLENARRFIRHMKSAV